jgi:hypothetical protein
MTKSRNTSALIDSVTAKGDLIAGTGANTTTNLSVGADGSTLVANSSASTGVSWAGNLAAGRNAVLNGAFDIWQRGTSITTNGTYTADRWYCSLGTPGSVSRQATSDTTNLPNIQYCARVGRNSGQSAQGFEQISQSLETVNSIPFAGKTVTMSFYARAGANFSSTSNALTLFLQSGTGTDQNVLVTWTGGATVINSTATLTTTWQRFTFTGTVPSTATQLGWQIYYQTSASAAGAADYFEITGIQLETGSVATPFIRQNGTLQGELAACQRYCYQTSASQDVLGSGVANSSTVAYTFVPWPTTMRSTPAVTSSSGGSYFTLYAGTVNPGVSAIGTVYNPTVRGALVSWTTSGLTQGYAVVAVATNANGYIRADAEL